MNVEEFREALRGAEPLDVVDQIILREPPVHVSPCGTDRIANALASAFGVGKGDVNIVITGSARLGFSIVEKRPKNGVTLPRYREFSADSDIDVAVISQPIFNLMWEELSDHYYRSPFFPPAAKKLGGYLVCGWLRPDLFPRGPQLRRCDDWWRTFKTLSADPFFERRQVRGGAYNSEVHLRQYMSRAVRDCIQQERMNEDGANEQESEGNNQPREGAKIDSSA